MITILASLVPDSEWEDKSLDLENTRKRVEKMYEHELLASYKPGSLTRLKEQMTVFDSACSSLIVIGPIEFTSTCAHHLLPFEGSAYVGYIPNGKIIGLSKPARAVHFFSKMLQVQERMTQQIADFLYEVITADTVIVSTFATHSCMTCRGVNQPNTLMSCTSQVPKVVRNVLTEFNEQVLLLQAKRGLCP